MKFHGHFWVILFAGILGWGAWGAASPELSTSWIRRQIRKHKIKTIDALLERFQPASLQQHLLVYGSESLQFASFQSPRVIVFNDDADFIMAFNGEPDSKGYYELEILKFNHDTSTFDPQLITFDPRGKEKPHFQHRPTACFDCHQTDARPNWDPYFHWVGFYGAEDDNTNAGEPGVPLVEGKEIEEYARFIAKKDKQVTQQEGRYRFLPERPSERPNLDFNDRVTCLASKRLVRTFASHPLAGRLLPAVESGHLNPELLPEDLVKRAKLTVEEVQRDTARVMGEAMQRRVKRHRELLGEDPRGRVKENQKPFTVKRYQYELMMPVTWRYVFEEIMGMDFRPFSTSRHKDYSLNLSAPSHIGMLLKGAKVDDRGKVVLSRVPNQREKNRGYRYVCPRIPSMRDLPIVEPFDKDKMKSELKSPN